MTPLLPPPIMYLSGVLPPYVLPSTFQLFLQAAVSARILIFEMGGLQRSCLFLRRLRLHLFPSHIPISTIQDREDKPFHLLILWLYPWFQNYVQLPQSVFFTTEDWAKYLRKHDNNWHRCCCFSMSCTVSSLKPFPYCWDCHRIWTFFLSHIPSPLECLPYSTWTGGLVVWSTPRHSRIPFFQSHPKCLYCTDTFPGKFLPRNALL